MINLALLSAAHIHTQSFLNDIARRGDCKLVALWDDVPDRGRRFASQPEHHAEFVPDLAAIVSRTDLDGFIICAENTRHLPLLAAAVPTGKPVFCEKPLATTAAEAAEVMALVRRHGAIVHLGYVQPFLPAIRGAAKLVADGAVGKVTHVRWRNSHNAAYGRWFDSADLAWFTQPELSGGGAFMDMGTHAVHALRTLFGPVERVTARIGNVSGAYPKVDDHGVALFQFASGVLGTVEASWVQNGGAGGLEVCGSEGTICEDPKVGGLALCRRKHEPAAVPPADEKPSRVARLIAAIKGELTREELDADLQAAADAVAIIEACYESSRTGRWVDVVRV